jgi:hypothetical protein
MAIPIINSTIIVRASAIGDNISSSQPWDPWADRHVAWRFVEVTPVRVNFDEVLKSLNASRAPGTRIQLLQVGAEAELALKIAAPHLKLDPAVQTHVLAELRPDGSLHLPSTVTAPVGDTPRPPLRR